MALRVQLYSLEKQFGKNLQPSVPAFCPALGMVWWSKHFFTSVLISCWKCTQKMEHAERSEHTAIWYRSGRPEHGVGPTLDQELQTVGETVWKGSGMRHLWY